MQRNFCSQLHEAYTTRQRESGVSHALNNPWCDLARAVLVSGRGRYCTLLRGQFILGDLEAYLLLHLCQETDELGDNHRGWFRDPSISRQVTFPIRVFSLMWSYWRAVDACKLHAIQQLTYLLVY